GNDRLLRHRQGSRSRCLILSDHTASRRFFRRSLIVKPNDWSRNVRKQSQDAGLLSDLKVMYQKYWQGFVEKLSAGQTAIRPRKPLPQHWLDFAIGKSGVSLSASASTQDQRIRVELYFSGEIGKTRFAALLNDKEDIEKAYGCALDWEPLPDRIGARISISRNGIRPDDQATWGEQHDWLVAQFIAFERVFRKRVATLV
ncbi:hypothetical protein C0V75_12605, partial [Tabrizicola sp. TH137]|uniref:DUF4268 domain-containing protein n=1 Tax=Tabrizicola sp. TH137 TaxID=2067452 RepID=UPI000CC3CDEA